MDDNPVRSLTEARAILARYPSLSLSQNKPITRFKKYRLSNDPTYLAMLDRIYTGLCEANMWEQ